jgi:branched-subunit amino acid aminotransferase/4-amino-4-deoxychorismate lyase
MDERVEIDGEPGDAEARALIEHGAWGHFTAMQVRGRRTRGLDLHLSRLVHAHRDIYGRDLDPALVVARVGHALGDLTDASVRVYAYWAGLIVTVRDPAGRPDRPHSMLTQHFQRPMAGLKHPGGWAQGLFQRRAADAGYDEGLLVDADGTISEGTLTNVAVWRDGTVVWPDAPMLPGITMLVLRREFEARGVAQLTARLRRSDLSEVDGMFLCNSRGWSPVNRVDDLDIPIDGKLVDVVAAAYDRARQDPI